MLRSALYPYQDYPPASTPLKLLYFRTPETNPLDSLTALELLLPSLDAWAERHPLDVNEKLPRQPKREANPPHTVQRTIRVVYKHYYAIRKEAEARKTTTAELIESIVDPSTRRAA